MNKYRKMLNRASNQAFINHCLTVKLKYKDKWLQNGTPMEHPIHIAFEAEFGNTNFRRIRMDIGRKYKTLDELRKFKRLMTEENADKYIALFNEDIKDQDRSIV